jgi:hypothetical protein
MQITHFQTKHPRGSSPHIETGQRMGDRLGRLRPIERTIAPTDCESVGKLEDGPSGGVNEATRDDSAYVARLLNVNKESVWKIIEGMEYSSYSELAMAVHRALAL